MCVIRFNNRAVPVAFSFPASVAEPEFPDIGLPRAAFRFTHVLSVVYNVEVEDWRFLVRHAADSLPNAWYNLDYMDDYHDMVWEHWNTYHPDPRECPLWGCDCELCLETL